MGDTSRTPNSRQTFWLIVLPMLGTVLSLRLYLHFVKVQHVYPGGYLVHHLFTGVLVLIPAAFVLAFGPGSRMAAVLARVALGLGSGLILDEMTFLVMTKAGDEDYVSTVSLSGAVVFLLLAAALLTALRRGAARRERKTPAPGEEPGVQAASGKDT